MGRPTQYPRQLVVQVTDETAARVDVDAAKRGDGSKSAAARRLLVLGALLADALESGALNLTIDDISLHEATVLGELHDAAAAVL